MIHRFQDQIINLKRVLYISDIKKDWTKKAVDGMYHTCHIEILFDNNTIPVVFPIKNNDTRTWHLVSDNSVASEAHSLDYFGGKYTWDDFEEYLEFKRQVRLLIDAYHKTV